MLGNLTVEKFEKDAGWVFSEEDKKWLEEHRTNEADFKDSDKFHIFDIPYAIVVGSEIVGDFMKIIHKYNNEKCCETRIAISQKN